VSIVLASKQITCAVTEIAPWSAACAARPRPRTGALTIAHCNGLSAARWKKLGGLQGLAEIAARSDVDLPPD
jgi:hypothetical protein